MRNIQIPDITPFESELDYFDRTFAYEDYDIEEELRNDSN